MLNLNEECRDYRDIFFTKHDWTREETLDGLLVVKVSETLAASWAKKTTAIENSK
jgi:hypothetical protein